MQIGLLLHQHVTSFGGNYLEVCRQRFFYFNVDTYDQLDKVIDFLILGTNLGKEEWIKVLNKEENSFVWNEILRPFLSKYIEQKVEVEFVVAQVIFLD